ncbi:MAG: M20/M25/M40 family metallo-hydrolase [bacterium]
MIKRWIQFTLVFSLLLVYWPTNAQTFPTDDPVIKAIWKAAMDSSRLELLAHQLLDVHGPRLVGTPQSMKAHVWAVNQYSAWGIPAKNEEYGKWQGWERGISHIDLLEPRVRSIEGTMLAWCPPTKKGGVTAGVVIFPDVADSIAFLQWLPSVKGKFVLMAALQPTGRPDKTWEEFALKPEFDRMKELRKTILDNWDARLRKSGFRRDTLAQVLEHAGAAGLIGSQWANGYGVYRIFSANTTTIPTVDLNLEDYGLVYRLTESSNKPILRIIAESKMLEPGPAMNTIATIRGTQKSDEYVMLSAHFDSWDGSSGATDNGTGTIMMMEAMRILKQVYPNPKRTIITGHWDSEEQGLNGSKAFVKDHPEVVEKLQALFNQDNGTGRIVSLSSSGYMNAAEFLARWIARIPSDVTSEVKLSFPGMPAGGGTDHASFDAAGAPGFGLGSNSWDYGYTWHTNRDTYDKLVFDELKNNVVLIACLVYLASEDPQFIPRDRRVLPVNQRTGQPGEWPVVRDPERAGRLKK